MRTVEKKIYYCDYCGKYRLTRGSMIAHESKCLLNTNRRCTAPYCAAAIGTSQEDVDYVRDYTIASGGIEGDDGTYSVEQKTIDEIRSRKEGCPICTIAVLCVTRFQMKKEGERLSWDYDIRPIAAAMYSEHMADSGY